MKSIEIWKKGGVTCSINRKNEDPLEIISQVLIKTLQEQGWIKINNLLPKRRSVIDG